MKQLTKRLLTRTCVWFTLLSVVLMVIYAVRSGADGTFFIELYRYFLLLPCSLFWAGAGIVYRYTAWGAFPRLLLHYLLTTLAFFLFLWLPQGGHGGVRNLLAVAFFTVGYAIVFALIRLTRRLLLKHLDVLSIEPVEQM